MSTPSLTGRLPRLPACRRAHQATAPTELLAPLPPASDEAIASVVVKGVEGFLAPAEEVVLGNGVRVLLKPTRLQDDEIRYCAMARGGVVRCVALGPRFVAGDCVDDRERDGEEGGRGGRARGHRRSCEVWGSSCGR